MAKGKISPASDRGRAIINRIMQKYGSKVTATQGYLRLETLVDSSRNNVDFDVLINDSINRATEKRLAQTDIFYATEISMQIYKVLDTDSATEFGSTLNTFPNPIEFSGAGEERSLMYLYNGRTNIEIDNNKIIEGMDNMRFYRAGQAQKGVEVSTGATNPSYVANEKNTASYGYYPLTPNVVFSGTAKNIVSIDLPESANLAGTSSSNYVVMIFRGILVQNASGYYKNMQSKAGRF